MSTELKFSGIHHVTAMTSDGQANLDFYTSVLGLRLVKVTVNFDDPGSYHLYYGDAQGSPGTILTFFVWPGGSRGRIGSPQTSVTSFRVPVGSIGDWQERLSTSRVAHNEPAERFGQKTLTLTDPDGLQLELVEDANATSSGIDLIRGVTLVEEGFENTARFLVDTLGFTYEGKEGNQSRYRTGDASRGATVDVICVPGGKRGSMGVGTVHHIAWRVVDDAQQAHWLKHVSAARSNVSPVMDRTYFHSIYFREPGGVLFEIATDNPGFSVDEPADALGTSLRLPPWMEKHRMLVEAGLPLLKLPGGATVGKPGRT
jgi:catechol 2,3-dioxygenase-like lactoylglutathione lyase family enzyme